MECKCPNLINLTFTLNVDLAKFHSGNIITNNGSRIALINNNIYKCANADLPTEINIQNIISEIKAEFCQCLQSRIDMIKFIVVDKSCVDLGWAGASVEHCSNRVSINADKLRSATDLTDLKSTLLHEIVHIFEFCSPCRNSDISNIVEQETDQLYKSFSNNIKEFYNTLDSLRQELLDLFQNQLNVLESLPFPDDSDYNKDIYIHIPKYKINTKPTFIRSYDKGRLYRKSQQTCFIAFMLAGGIDNIISFMEDRFLYASPNIGGRAEFLAAFTQIFCSESNNAVSVAFQNILEEFEEFEECADSIRSNTNLLISLIRQRFDQNFFSIARKICDLWTKISTNNTDCDFNFNNEYSLKLDCVNTDQKNCCLTYNIYIKAADGACCKSSNNTSKGYILIGTITKQNSCDCEFMYISKNNSKALEKMLTNCCEDKLSSEYQEQNNNALLEDIENQIISVINSQNQIKVIRDLPEKSNPCSN